MGGRASRQKGDRREREMVARLQALGLPSHRVPLSGALGGDYSGDLVVDLSLRLGGGPPLRAEVKGRAGAEGWKTLKKWLGDNSLLFLLEDRAAPLVMLTWEVFARLVGGEDGRAGFTGPACGAPAPPPGQ